MFRIPFDIDRAMRSCGADVFASSASDAQVEVCLGDRQARVAVRYHVNRLRRAVFRARAAMFVARVDDAVLFNKDDVAHLDEVFFLDGQGANRAGGADVAAHRAVEVAESVREVDARLKKSPDDGKWRFSSVSIDAIVER